jgi:hypothetical protein
MLNPEVAALHKIMPVKAATKRGNLLFNEVRPFMSGCVCLRDFRPDKSGSCTFSLSPDTARNST